MSLRVAVQMDPLHSINMAGMVLERTGSAGSGNQPTLAKRIQSSTNRMQRMISQVLDMSRIDRGMGLGVTLEPVDLKALLVDLMDEARLAYPSIPLDLVCDDAATVNADSSRLAQVLSNLLSNSIKFTPPGGEVILRATDDNGSPLIEVLDTGPGIPEAERVAVFQRFYRVDDKHSGFGLGLSIVAAIVNLHGFSLEVNNRESGGARLTLHCRQSLINPG